jgi:hypothetical protein
VLYCALFYLEGNADCEVCCSSATATGYYACLLASSHARLILMLPGGFGQSHGLLDCWIAGALERWGVV